MTMQLTLIETPKDWQLDDHTRQVGRAGLVKARAALRDGRSTRPDTIPKVPPGGDRGDHDVGRRRPAA
jgi:hypothetical protein